MHYCFLLRRKKRWHIRQLAVSNCYPAPFHLYISLHILSTKRTGSYISISPLRINNDNGLVRHLPTLFCRLLRLFLGLLRLFWVRRLFLVLLRLFRVRPRRLCTPCYILRRLSSIILQKARSLRVFSSTFRIPYLIVRRSPCWSWNRSPVRYSDHRR